MNELQNDLLRTFDAKLHGLVNEFDESVRAEIREVWKSIDPGPSCRYSSELLMGIHEIVGKAYVDRGRQAAEVVRTSLCDIPDGVIVAMGDPFKQIIEQFFLNDPYLLLVSNTPGVYERRNAFPGKFFKESYDHHMALIKVTAANVTRRSIDRMNLLIVEAVLKAKARREGAQAESTTTISIVNSTLGSLQTGAGSISTVSLPA
ncbi:MAG: hypothetical protein V4476_17225 [Pseudomonadota bacterium]